MGRIKSLVVVRNDNVDVDEVHCKRSNLFDCQSVAMSGYNECSKEEDGVGINERGLR